ncbi:hypothetical protein VDG1235_1419 [Verrucomicrobiia bacterium DG1235]|nr:hypothetical protein VDG1235_1419 [Verrucomicrobiae bacterium DG1235]
MKKLATTLSSTFKALTLAIGIVGWVVGIAWLTHQKQQTTVEGKILDAGSGQPVAEGKVVVSTWNYGLFDSNPRNFGTTTDTDGNFTIHANPGFWIRRIDIAASGPGDRIGIQMNIKYEQSIIKIRPLDFDQSPIKSYGHADFGGAWSGKVEWKDNPNKS